MTICYFTATGNCLYVARRIGGTLLSIPQLMRQERIEIEDDAVGVVCPVYNAEMPMMVRDLMRKAIIRTGVFLLHLYLRRGLWRSICPCEAGRRGSRTDA